MRFGTVAAALVTWRDAERLLEELTPLSPDHETASLMAASMRATCELLSASPSMSEEALRHTGAAIDHVRMVLAAIRMRHASTARRDGDPAPAPDVAAPALDGAGYAGT